MTARQLKDWICATRRFVYVLLGHSLRAMELLPDGTTLDDGDGAYERRWRAEGGTRGRNPVLVLSTEHGHDTMRLQPYGVGQGRNGGECVGLRGRWDIPNWAEVVLKPAAPVPSAAVEWPAPQPGECVLTACDRRQEWMLPRWYQEVRKHTDRPVVFGDLGLSSRGRKWCQSRGRVTHIDTEALDTAFFAKAIAILQTGFRRTLWMDCDCLLRADPSPLFAREAELVLARDCPLTENGASAQSGVVRADHGSVIARQWAAACQRGFLLPMSQLGARFPDQHLLDSLCTLNPDRVTVVDRLWNWVVVWGGLEPTAKIWHFAGGAKELLRQLAADLSLPISRLARCFPSRPK